MFDNLCTAPPTTPTTQDKLSRYLAAPTEAVGDVIAWWLKNRKTYPALSCMALDYLSIPGEWLLLLYDDDIDAFPLFSNVSGCGASL